MLGAVSDKISPYVEHGTKKDFVMRICFLM